jgi:hypothetical protein
MRQLVESTGSISSKLAVTREKADSITQVVTTITRVADQTNLLSTNAASEGEKAGEHGRGFQVVAREARRLADQAAVATLGIESRARRRPAPCGRTSPARRCAPATSCSKTPPRIAPRAGVAFRVGGGRPGPSWPANSVATWALAASPGPAAGCTPAVALPGGAAVANAAPLAGRQARGGRGKDTALPRGRPLTLSPLRAPRPGEGGRALPGRRRPAAASGRRRGDKVSLGGARRDELSAPGRSRGGNRGPRPAPPGTLSGARGRPTAAGAGDFACVPPPRAALFPPCPLPLPGGPRP